VPRLPASVRLGGGRYLASYLTFVELFEADKKRRKAGVIGCVGSCNKSHTLYRSKRLLLRALMVICLLQPNMLSSNGPRRSGSRCLDPARAPEQKSDCKADCNLSLGFLWNFETAFKWLFGCFLDSIIARQNADPRQNAVASS
jgi:hypothetical protein